MKNLGKQITIAVVASVLVFGIGYALFSDTITVSGTATATGTMNVVIDSATMTTSIGGGTADTNTATVAGDGKSVTLAVPGLQYPGSSVTFTVNLKNTGNLGAKVTNIGTTGLGAAEEDLYITYNGIAVNDVIAGNNGTDSVTVNVSWPSASSHGFTGNPFSIVLDFVQNTP